MKSQREKGRPAHTFLQRVAESLGEYLGRPSRKDDSPASPAAAPSPAGPKDAGYTRALPGAAGAELLANLLLEFPGHRDRLSTLCANRDYESLAAHAHKLRGAVVYCDLPELAQALHTLQLALGSQERQSIEAASRQAIQAIDDTLMKSGYNGS